MCLFEVIFPHLFIEVSKKNAHAMKNQPATLHDQHLLHKTRVSKLLNSSVQVQNTGNL
jgi:hypothetical protein